MIALLILLSLAACSRGENASDGGTESVVVAATATPTTAPPPEPSVDEVAGVDDSDTDDSNTDDSDAENAESADATNGETLNFQIDRTQSEARFLINEVLLGADKTVVGATSLITGTFSVDPADPASATLSTIVVNARDIKTDSSRRDRSIQRRVLKSVVDDYEFIVFQPTALVGLPEKVAVGDSFEFQVIGDLTIVDITQEETFDMAATVISEQEIALSGSTTVLYPDYELAIPSVPAVASVEDEVRIEIERATFRPTP